MAYDIDTVNTDITREEDRGSRQRTLKSEKKTGYVLLLFRFHLKKNGRPKSQTKAHEIRGK